MNKEDQIALQVTEAIMNVLELCYQQGVTTSWRDIFLFLRFPEAAWKDDIDLDEKIIIRQDSDLVIMRAMISSKFATKH